MADAKPPAKILRVLGNSDPVLERIHVGIYDYLDSLTSLAFTHSVALQTPITDVEAYTTIETVGFPFTKRRLLNFAGPFLITDDVTNQRTNIDIGLFGAAIKGAVPASGGGSTNFLRADGVWSPAGGGLTQLTGDVLAGPGTGSQVATLANIPAATPAAGSLVFTNVAAPGVPAVGKTVMWIDSGSGATIFKDHFGILAVAVTPRTSPASQWVNGLSSAGVLQTSQPAFADLSGSLAAGQFGPLTGDVTTSGYAATLARIPSATPALGSILFTAIAAPGTPAAGSVIQWADTTSKKMQSKDQFGNISTNVVIGSATAHQFATNVSSLGVLTTAQPDFTDLTGSLAAAQFGPLTGDVTTSGYAATIAANAVTNAKLRQGGALTVIGVAGNATANVADIASSAGSGFALRESGSTIGFGTLATAAYGANTVTYAKLQTETGNTLLGRGSGGAGNVQELTVTGAGSFGASSLNIPKQFSMTWGGGLAVGGVLAIPRVITIGLGDNSYFDSTSPVYPNMAFAAPLASTAQDWSVNLAHSTLTGGGFFELDFYVNGAFVAILGTFSAGTFPQSVTISTSQVISLTDRLAIRMYTSAGSITGGSVVLYIVGSFR